MSTDGLHHYVSQVWQSSKLTLAMLARHPRRVGASLALVLLGTGVTAFGLVPLAPDAADLPVTLVVETVQPLPWQAGKESRSDLRFNLYRTEVSRSSDTAESLLRRLGIDDQAAAAFLRSDTLARSLLVGRAGKTLTAETTNDQQLLKMAMRWATDDDTHFQRLVIERVGKTFSSRLETAPYSVSTRVASGVIKTSLFAATDEAHIPDAVATQIAGIFSGDIDFHRSLRKGDRFSVFYESLEADGEALKTGKVLNAEFINNGKSFQAVWFTDPTMQTAAVPGTPAAAQRKLVKGSYYTLDGQSLRKAYLASPMEFSRMSSGFKMRFHPILQTWRAHLGVDYAAPTGTAVRAVGDGVVAFAGSQGGFGNVVFVDHSSGHTTVYAHLSRIKVQRGARVTQGQTLGAVGATGWATGPHLHFEFRVNGKHQDPTQLARQSESIPLPEASMPAFKKLATNARELLQAATVIGQSRAE